MFIKRHFSVENWVFGIIICQNYHYNLQLIIKCVPMDLLHDVFSSLIYIIPYFNKRHDRPSNYGNKSSRT